MNLTMTVCILTDSPWMHYIHQELLAFVYPEVDEGLAAKKLRRTFDLYETRQRINVEDVFATLDDRRTNCLKKKVFRGLVHDLGLPLTEDETGILIDKFDYKGDGSTDYHNFCNFVMGRKVDEK